MPTAPFWKVLYGSEMMVTGLRTPVSLFSIHIANPLESPLMRTRKPFFEEVVAANGAETEKNCFASPSWTIKPWTKFGSGAFGPEIWTK